MTPATKAIPARSEMKRPAPSGRSPRRAFALLVLVAVVAMVAGLGLGRLVRSPEQKIADAAPPGFSVITAEARERELEAEVVTRGVIALGRTVKVGPVKSSDPLSVVTKVGVATGAQVKAGALLLEVSGRPVFLLEGDFPAYRDLALGDRGPDAAAVNKALRGLELTQETGDAFTSGSQEGLATLYRRAGYEPPGGGRLDRREIVFVPAAEAAVLSVSAQVGNSSENEELVVLAAGETTVTALVAPSQAASIETGNPATVHLDDRTAIPATVVSVTIGETLEATKVVLRPESPVDASLNGNDVRVAITQTSTDRTVLTVPVPAIFARADGQNVVVRVAQDSSRQVIAVNVGDIVGGFAAIGTPDGEPALQAGDQVIVSGPGVGR